MKKQYINPQTVVIRMATAGMLAASGTIDSGTPTGPAKIPGLGFDDYDDFGE